MRIAEIWIAERRVTERVIADASNDQIVPVGAGHREVILAAVRCDDDAWWCVIMLDDA